MPNDLLQIGTLKYQDHMTHFSVYEKQYSREISGLRGTNSNLPNGKNMIHVDFRFIVTGKNENVTEHGIPRNDVDAFRRLIAQLRACPIFPVKNNVIRALTKATETIEVRTELNDRIKVKAKDILDSKITNLETVYQTKLNTLHTELDRHIDAFNRFNGNSNFRLTDEVFGTYIVDIQKGINSPLDTIYAADKKLVESISSSDNKDTTKSIKLKYSIKSVLEKVDTLDIINTKVLLVESAKQQTVLSSATYEEDLTPQATSQQDNDNTYLAVSNIEWMTHPAIKVGFVVKISAVYFNHYPYIPDIRYIKDASTTTYDLAECSLFEQFYNRYLTSTGINSSDLKSGDEERSWNMCKEYKDSPTSFYYNIFKYTTEYDPLTGSEASDAATGVVFNNINKRDYSVPTKVSGFDTTDGSFTKTVECSLNWPLSIVPLQGAQHSTIQFYGKPVGKTAITLHIDDVDKSLDTVNEIKKMSDSIRNQFSFEQKKYLKFNPILVDNQLTTLGGMYYFNIEDISTTTIEDTKGSLDMILTMYEQQIPSLEREETLEGLVEFQGKPSLSNVKLSTVLSFLADDKLASTDITYVHKRLDILEKLKALFNAEFWLSYHVTNLMPTTYKIGRGEGTNNIRYELAKDQTIPSSIGIPFTKQYNSVSAGKFTPVSKSLEVSDSILKHLFNLSIPLDILATLGTYKDTPFSDLDSPLFFSNDGKFYPSWSYLNELIKKGDFNILNTQSSAYAELLKNGGRNPLELYGSGYTLTTFVSDFIKDNTFGLFSTNTYFEGNNSFSGFNPTTGYALPINETANLIKGLIDSNDPSILNLQAVQAFHKIWEALVTSEDPEIKALFVNVTSKEFDTAFTKYKSDIKSDLTSSNNSWDILLTKAASSLVLSTLANIPIGIGNIPAEGKITTRIVKILTSTALKTFYTTNPASMIGRTLGLYGGELISNSMGAKAGAILRISSSIGRKILGFAGVALSLYLTAKNQEYKNQTADSINLMVGDTLNMIYTGYMYDLLLNNNAIPNDAELSKFSEIINTRDNLRNVLDDVYNEVIDLGYGVITNNPVKPISAYPDFNLPTYRELLKGDVNKKELTKIVATIQEGLAEIKAFTNNELVTSSLDAILGYMSDISSDTKNKLNTIGVELSKIQLKLLALEKDNGTRFTLGRILSKLVTQVRSIEPTISNQSSDLINNLIPTYGELGIEPPYVNGNSNPHYLKARSLDHYVDPAFFVSRDTINPMLGLSNNGEIFKTQQDVLNPKMLHGNPLPSSNGAEQAYIEAVNTSLEIPSDKLNNPDLIDTDLTSLKTGNIQKYTIGKSKDGTFTGIEDQHAIMDSAKTQNDILTNEFEGRYLYTVSSLGRHANDFANNLNKAFPTFAVFFIHENDNYLYEPHLLADFYLYQNVMDIAISQDKLEGSVATLTMSNIWGTLDNNTFKRGESKKAPGSLRGNREANKKYKFKEIKLEEGILIQIKQGYSSNFDELENAFTGKVSEYSNGDIVTIICQGHEQELMNRARENLDVGITTGQNYYDYAAQLLKGTRQFGLPFSSAETEDLIKYRRSHSKQLYSSSTGIIKPWNISSNFLVSNFDVDRNTENIYIPNYSRAFIDWYIYNDFKVTDQSKLEALHEISRYHHNNVCLPLPYDSRATLFMGPPDHPYKYTSKRDTDIVNYEKELSSISPFYNKRTNKFDTFSVVKSIIDNLDNSSFILDPKVYDKIRYEESRLRAYYTAIAGNIESNTRSLGLDPISNKLFTQNRNQLLTILSEIYKLRYGLPSGLHTLLVNNTFKDFSSRPIYPTISNFLDMDAFKFTIEETSYIDYSDLSNFLKSVPLDVKLLFVSEFIKQWNKSNVSLGRLTPAGTVYTNTGRVKELKTFSTTLALYLETDPTNKSKTKYGKPVKNVSTDGTLLKLVKSLENPGSTFALRSFTEAVLGKPKEGIYETAFGNKVKDAEIIVINMKLYYMCMCGMLAKYMQDNSSNTDVEEMKFQAMQESEITTLKNKLQHVPGYKPFRNHHVVLPKHIIDNNITVSTAVMANEVHVMTPKPTTDYVRQAYNLAAGLLYDVSKDDSYWSNQIASFSVLQAPNGKIIRRIVEPNAYTKTQQVNISFRRLADAMKPMYTGTLTLLGKQNIKPYDIIHLRDAYHSMNGPIEVNRVTHVHSSTNGWTTVIEPHLVNHYAEMEGSGLIIAVNSLIGLVELVAVVGGLSSLAGGIAAGLGISSSEILGAETLKLAGSTFVNQVKTKWAQGAMPMMGELGANAFSASMTIMGIDYTADMVRSAADSDVLNSYLFTPLHTTYGIGSGPIGPTKDNTDFLRPVMLSPLSKDGSPYLAGMVGLRDIDSVSRYGLAGGLASAHWKAFNKGIASSTTDISNWWLLLKEDLHRYARNVRYMNQR